MSSFSDQFPQATAEFYPESTEQVAAAVQEARQRSWAIIPWGNGSKLDWGGQIQSELPLCGISTSKLNRLIDHAAGDLTVTLETGMTYVRLQEILAQRGQFLALDPPLAAGATIGGILATGCNGSWRQRYLGVRDMCLGLTMVRADGEVVKAGGRVVKNVAGYDLMKLLTGSYGSLGIVTQVTLRVYPIAAAAQTLMVTGSLEEILALSQKILLAPFTPSRLDLVAGSYLRDLGSESEFALVIEFSGISESVQFQALALVELAGKLVVVEAQPQIWQHISDLIWQPGRAIAKVGLLATDFLAVWPEIRKLAGDGWIQLHGSSGWLSMGDQVSAGQVAEIRQSLRVRKGWLSLVRSPLGLKQELSDLWGYGPDTAKMMRLLKQKFDPEYLLNPGRV